MLWTFMSKFLWKLYVFSSLEYIPRSGITGLYNTHYLALWRIPNFQSTPHHSTFLPALYEDFSFSTSLPILVVCFLIIAILVSIKWYLVWVWFTFFWWIMMLSIFSICCWPFLYLFWRNICLNALVAIFT